MKSFIEELYSKELYERMKKDIISPNVTEVIKNCESILFERLVGDDRHVFWEYMNACGEALSDTDLYRFTEGFRFGAKFMYAVMENDENKL